jgi:hypothetical protein
MARPLRYDDQFMTVINEKIHDKFLNLISMKVQSTAFFQKMNLQQALTLCSVIDFLIGLIIFFYFFIEIEDEGFLYLSENFLLVLGMLFGIIGFDASTNLKKKNSGIYKNWRIFITFSIPLIELIQSNKEFCYFKKNCNFFRYFSITIIYLIINLYLTKIAWSFCIRINKNHELLLIHGKYLEKMIKEENYKVKDMKKYIPPQLLKPQKNLQSEKDLISLGTSGNLVEEQMFAPNKTKTNPFLASIQALKNNN